MFLSPLLKGRLDKLLNEIIKVKLSLEKRVKTNVLNDVLMDVQMMNPSPSINGGRIQISFAKQVDSKIPTFKLFVNNKKYLHFSYKRYLENQLRHFFGFEGTPLRLLFINKKTRDKKFDKK